MLLGPSKRYSFSTTILGIRRRLAASASRARVSLFSSTSSSWQAASHSCGVTIGGVSIWAPRVVVVLAGEIAPSQHRYVESRKSIGPRPGACLGLPDRGTPERGPEAPWTPGEGRGGQSCALRDK